MRKICLLIGLFCSILVYGQMSPEGFEATKFPPENWTIYHLLNRAEYNFNGWQKKVFSTESPEMGKTAAYSLSGKYQQKSDSWLITPNVKVRPGDHLNFMLKIEKASETTEDSLEILVSEAGKEKVDFVHKITTILPRHDTEWTAYCIDLSAFANKNIHIAFHDFLLKPTSNYAGCDVYLDNVEVSEKSTPNLSVSAINSPNTDCSTIQFVEMTVTNTGKTVDSYNVCYAVNGQSVVRQSVKSPIAFGEEKKISFKEPVEFKEDSENTFTAWLEYKGNTRGDSLTKVVHIGRQIAYPYTLSASTTPDSDFKSYNGLRGKWNFQKNTVTGNENFIYMGRSKGGFLASNCIYLPKGKVRVTLNYITTQHAQLEAYTAPVPGLDKYVDLVGSSDLLLGNGKENKASFTLDIPEEGWQTLGFLLKAPGNTDFVSTAVGVNGVQFILTDLMLEDVKEDLVMSEIVSPAYEYLPVSKEKTDLIVSLSNQGLNAQSNFTLNYQLDDQKTVSETYTGSLAAGEQQAYTFATPMDWSKQKHHTLKVWVNAQNDLQHNNDTIVKSYWLYDAYEMPYLMDLEGENEINHWTVRNDNQDILQWQLTTEGCFKGLQSFFLPTIKNLNNEDFLVSPAVKLPKGKARVAFFYNLAAAGKLKMQVWMGKEVAKMDTLLFETSTPTAGWENLSVVTDVKEEGTYYFAIGGVGTGGNLLLDEIRIDSEVDACVRDLSFVEKGSYNLTTSAVRMVVANYGTKDIVNPKVAYQVENGEEVVETIEKTIAVGETLEYVFQEQVDITKTGTLHLKGRVEAKGDVEESNNTMYATKEHYANLELPYFQNFEDDGIRERWTMTALDLNNDGKSWMVAGNAQNYAYGGKSALYYDSRYMGDDWIFSECIAIPAGDFEMSFFYRTNKNYKDRKENFKVMLGKAQTPEAMTIEIADFKETSVFDPQECMKVIRRIQMKEPGNYFIGIYCYSPVSKGCIYIDDIEIKPYEAKQPFYQSDFKNRFAEWTAYKPSSFFDQWLKVTEEGRADDIVQMKTAKTYKPGIFVSPGFQLAKAQPVTLQMDYALITPNEKDTLGLYMGTENHPDSLTTQIAALPATKGWETYTQEIKVEKDGRYFFAIKAQRAGRDKNVLYKLGSFSLAPAGLESFEVKGMVTDAAGNALSDVAVELLGGQPQAALTGGNGQFSFAKVVDKQHYTLKLTKENYLDKTVAVTLNGKAEDLGTIVLNLDTQSPVGLHAALNDSAQTVTLDWLAPDTEMDFRYDDGKVFGNVGFSKGTAKNVMGTAFRTPASVNEISWYTVAAQGVHDKVNLYLLDLNAEGQPTNKVLYEALDVASVDNQWNSWKLPAAVDAPNGFMVAISYNQGALNLGVDDGADDYPFQESTQFIGNLESGVFQSLESQNATSNLMLRAKGKLISVPQHKLLAVEATSLAYDIYRFSAADAEEEAKWVKLNGQPVKETHYVDDIAKLDGEYQYAVKTVYPTGETSAAVLSEVVVLDTETGINGAETAKDICVSLEEGVLLVQTKVAVQGYVLYNAAGAVVAQDKVNGTQFQIAVAGGAQGTYVLRLNTTAGLLVKKVWMK